MYSHKDQGIEAVNQDFTKYEQVNKSQVYHLSETADTTEEFDTETQIKTCDMSRFFHGGKAGREQFALELGEALAGIGFAILVNHGVPTELHRQGIETTRNLFESTTLAERMKYLAARQGSVNQGYFPMRETTIIHPDLVEGWVFCRRAFNLIGSSDFQERAFWPRSGYEPFFRKIVQEHEKLILPITQSIFRCLGCDPHLYDDKLTGTNFGFRLNYYPALSESDLESGAGRMLGHEDVDLFTILPAQNVDGLQVLNRQNMKWIHIDAPDGSIILNTGDYMQRITNDRLPSTTHRVSRPRNPDLYGLPRITFPMAIYVWEDEMLEVLPGLGVPRYEPISAVKFHTRITSKYYGDDYAEDVDQN